MLIPIQSEPKLLVHAADAFALRGAADVLRRGVGGVGGGYSMASCCLRRRLHVPSTVVRSAQRGRVCVCGSLYVNGMMRVFVRV